MDYNGRDEKEAQEEFPLYTERIIINPKVKYKKLFSFLKFLGGAVIFGVIACAVIVLLYPYFDKIICATMVKSGKPSPDIYQYACRQLELMPQECMAVEDSPNGVMSAYCAGCKVVLVPDQSEPEEELKDKLYGCVESLDKIEQYFL